MSNAATENLFLLEFLVDKVFIDTQAISGDINALLGESCVQFDFLDNAPLDVCEADFTPKDQFSVEGANFKSGKSVLFALSAEQAQTAVDNFNINVKVFKKVVGNAAPDKICVGKCSLQIVNEFNELLRTIESNNGQLGAKVIKDTFSLANPVSGKISGDITVFVRLSCFGKLIVTQFQMNMEEHTVLFKDNQGQSMYKYKKSKKDDVNECEQWDKATRPEDSARPLSQKNYPPSTAQTYPEDKLPCSTPDDRCYQEIGAEMNGNAITIRVLKDHKSNDEDCDCCATSETEYDPDECTCCLTNKSGNNKSKTPAIKAVAGDHPPALNFQVKGCGNTSKNCINVVPPTTNADGYQVTEISDPKRDVFVLKIGKKNEDKKANIELELRTPKGIDRKPPPKLETRDTQCVESEFPPASGGGGKGKKGDKKGGKKGGKKNGGGGGKGGGGGRGRSGSGDSWESDGKGGKVRKEGGRGSVESWESDGKGGKVRKKRLSGDSEISDGKGGKIRRSAGGGGDGRGGGGGGGKGDGRGDGKGDQGGKGGRRGGGLGEGGQVILGEKRKERPLPQKRGGTTCSIDSLAACLQAMKYCCPSYTQMKCPPCFYAPPPPCSPCNMDSVCYRGRYYCS